MNYFIGHFTPTEFKHVIYVNGVLCDITQMRFHTYEHDKTLLEINVRPRPPENRNLRKKLY